MKHIGYVVAGALLMVLGAASARAQQNGDPPPKPASPSLFTPEQAARGQVVYQKVCIECHELLEYTGADFRLKWNARPAFDLFDLLRNTMPDENPGTLSRQEYADVMAYMMKLNGVPPGKTPLPSDDAGLKKIKVEIPK